MKLAIITRGVPGCGKSTFAETLQKRAKDKGLSCNTHTTDTFFVINGNYIFRPEKLGIYHKANLNAFIESLNFGIDIVICANTNTTPKEYRKYVNEAKEAGYSTVSIVFIPDQTEVHFARNTHGVPKFVVAKMVHNLNNNLETEGVDSEINLNQLNKVRINSSHGFLNL